MLAETDRGDRGGDAEDREEAEVATAEVHTASVDPARTPPKRRAASRSRAATRGAHSVYAPQCGQSGTGNAQSPKPAEIPHPIAITMGSTPTTPGPATKRSHANGSVAENIDTNTTLRSGDPNERFTTREHR